MRHDQPGYYTLADLPQRKPIGPGFSTGWEEMDIYLKLYLGQFIVVTGIAGHGKSTFLQNIVCNIARRDGLRSFLYVPENEGFIRHKLRALWPLDDASFDHFATHQCFLQSALPQSFNDPAKTLDWVLDQAVVAVRNDGVSLVVIDPWNELERAKPKDQLLTDYIGECLMMAKQFCRAMEAIVVVVAHPTKASKENAGGVPNLSDIEGSMNWFNKCDNGLIVVRDPNLATAKVISAKVRELGAGSLGTCHFFVDPQTGLYTPQIGADIAKIEAARNGFAQAPLGNKRDNEGYSERKAGPWNTR